MKTLNLLALTIACAVSASASAACFTVLGKDGQFAHALQGLGDFLEITVLGLRERHGVADVVLGRAEPADLSVEPGADGHAGGVIRGVDDFVA